jgi:hypothetical protein
VGFNERYTEAQREAVARAYVDRHIRPARAVAELARRGELESVDGERLASFEIGESTIRSFAGLLRRRRRGEVRSNLAAASPRDAVEALRVRLVNAADAGLAAVERRQRREHGKTDWEELRQIARAVREISSLPDPSEGRSTAPGLRDPSTGERRGGQTRGGLAPICSALIALRPEDSTGTPETARRPSSQRAASTRCKRSSTACANGSRRATPRTADRPRRAGRCGHARRFD